MRAGSLVGRVGALAVALGVGLRPPPEWPGPTRTARIRRQRGHLCRVVTIQFFGDDVRIGNTATKTRKSAPKSAEARQRGTSRQAAGRQIRQGRVCRRGRQGRQKPPKPTATPRRTRSPPIRPRTRRRPKRPRTRPRPRPPQTRARPKLPRRRLPNRTRPRRRPTPRPSSPKAPEPTLAVEEQTTSTSVEEEAFGSGPGNLDGKAGKLAARDRRHGRPRRDRRDIARH